MPLKRVKPLKRSSRSLRKVNPEAKAKRVKKQKAHYASAEYKAARKKRMEFAGGQCEAWHVWGEDLSWAGIRLPDEDYTFQMSHAERCQETTGLQFHELDYGSDLGLIRPIRGVILCKADHSYIEKTRHPTRHPR